MDETRKIIIIAFLSIAGAAYGYAYGYLSLLEYYIVFGGLIIPGIGGYTAWTIFIRKAFSLHFQNEEGNHLREVGYVRILSYDKDKSIYDYKRGGVLRQFWIDSRNTVYTDRFNKSHLFFPINNLFAYHPFAKTFSLKEGGDIPEEFKTYLKPEEDIKVPDEVLTKEQAQEKKENKLKVIGGIPIEFFTLMTVSAIEFAQMFSGKLIIARIEAMRTKVKKNKGDLLLGVVLGLMVGLLIGIVVYPQYTSYQANAHTPSSSPPMTNTITTSIYTTSTVISTTQSIPHGAILTGQSSSVIGNVTISYSTYANNSTTVTITNTSTSTK